jgi:hypothetical protein
MRRSPYEGKFKPKNPNKYLGDLDNIEYRSSLELNSFVFLDSNPFVLGWSSEEIAIDYMKPMPDGSIKPSKYYPDLYVEYIDKDKTLKKVIIEIKPEKLIRKSKARNKKTAIVENYTYMINMLKAEAAMRWCVGKNIEYRFAVEKNIIR